MRKEKVDFDFVGTVRAAAPGMVMADVGSRIQTLCGFLRTDIESGGKALLLGDEASACAALGAAAVAAVQSGISEEITLQIIASAYRELQA